MTRCPFVDDPFEECHVASLTSGAIERAIAYCGVDYEACAIYQAHVPARHPPGGLEAKAPLRILLADDGPVIRELVKALLEREGFDVVGEAADGAEAVRLAQALHPDVAILDFRMPRQGGLEAAREIRQMCPGTRVILLTTHAEDYEIATALGPAIQGYVVKAETTENLVRAVKEVSRGRIFVSPRASHVVIDAYLREPRTS
jgi:CheY-like chemotaxis protein